MPIYREWKIKILPFGENRDGMIDRWCPYGLFSMGPSSMLLFLWGQKNISQVTKHGTTWKWASWKGLIQRDRYPFRRACSPSPLFFIIQYFWYVLHFVRPLFIQGGLEPRTTTPNVTHTPSTYCLGLLLEERPIYATWIKKYECHWSRNETIRLLVLERLTEL